MGFFDDEIFPQIDFKYENFEAPIELKNKVQICMRKIISQAPSKSRAEVIFKQNGAEIFGVINLQSLHGEFSALGESNCLETLIFNLTSEVEQKLNLWKRNRFKKSESSYAS